MPAEKARDHKAHDSPALRGTFRASNAAWFYAAATSNASVARITHFPNPFLVK